MPRQSEPIGAHRPSGLPLMRMQWLHLLFMHWRIEAEKLRPLIPESLEIDEFDGSAWVGLIPFTMRTVQPAVVPAMPGVSDIPALTAFHECNVRTYVHPRGRPDQPGVWFFSLDAASRPAVWAAGKFFRLPYFFARMSLERVGDEVRYGVDRIDSPQATMCCTWRAGEPLPRSRPGELAHFLTERYALYSADGAGRLFRCRIWHKPWALRIAEVISWQDELVRAAGIEVDQSQPPARHHADFMDMRAWRLERVKDRRL